MGRYVKAKRVAVTGERPRFPPRSSGARFARRCAASRKSSGLRATARTGCQIAKHRLRDAAPQAGRAAPGRRAPEVRSCGAPAARLRATWCGASSHRWPKPRSGRKSRTWRVLRARRTAWRSKTLARPKRRLRGAACAPKRATDTCPGRSRRCVASRKSSGLRACLPPSKKWAPPSTRRKICVLRQYSRRFYFVTIVLNF